MPLQPHLTGLPRLPWCVANLCGYDIALVPIGSELPIVEEAAYIAASLELATPEFFSRTFTAAESKVLVEVKGINGRSSARPRARMPTCRRPR